MAATGITGAVAMNGQYIVLDGQTIYKDPISIENIEKLHTLAIEQDEALAFYGKEGYWVDRHTDFVRQAYAYTHMPLPRLTPKVTNQKKSICSCY